MGFIHSFILKVLTWTLYVAGTVLGPENKVFSIQFYVGKKTKLTRIGVQSL